MSKQNAVKRLRSTEKKNYCNYRNYRNYRNACEKIKISLHKSIFEAGKSGRFTPLFLLCANVLIAMITNTKDKEKQDEPNATKKNCEKEPETTDMLMTALPARPGTRFTNEEHNHSRCGWQGNRR